jgi:hypothetical protein
MHTPGVFKRNSKLSLLGRLRGASALRVVLIVATLLASQNALACAFEEAFAAQAIEIVASEESEEEDCCTLCFDCAHCGGCHSAAESPRATHGHLPFQSITFTNLTLATVAPKLWTPPALLRPPISAA